MLFQIVDEAWWCESTLRVCLRVPQLHVHSGCAQAVGFQGPVKMSTSLLNTVATTHRSQCGVFPVGPACYAHVQLCDTLHKCHMKCHMPYAWPVIQMRRKCSPSCHCAPAETPRNRSRTS